ncbi:porin [Orbaceae bacterium ac157xtp]
MKRNLLAIAIPALLVAGAANASIEVWNKDGNKLNVNGRVKALNYVAVGSSDDANDKEGDDTTARLGFTGETQVTDSLTGYGRAEWETKTGGASFKETRYAFAGLNFGEAGSIDYGRNDGVLKAITAYTDVLPEFGGDAAENTWYVLSARSDAVLTYRNAALVEGLSFALQYADDKEYGNEGYGLNAQYEILDTGLTVGASYAQLSGDNGKSWNAGIKYDANDLYLAAIYAQSKDMNVKGSEKVRGFEVVAQYGIDFEVGRLTPSVAYVQHKTRSPSDDLAKYVEAGVNYDFNKNLSAIVDYKFNLIDDTKDTLGLALIYQF